MKPRRLIDSDRLPSGGRIELVHEGGHYTIRVDGGVLMSSAASGSEQAMATAAAERLGPRPGLRVLVGGLGLGYTARAALDAFPADVRITVAELLPAVVRFNRGELGDLAGRPLDDSRVTLAEADVRTLLSKQAFDAILLDVDNGPDAFTIPEKRRALRCRRLAAVARRAHPRRRHRHLVGIPEPPPSKKSPLASVSSKTARSAAAAIRARTTPLYFLSKS